MFVRRSICAAALALALAGLTTSTAGAAARSCGARGYAYAGVMAQGGVYGVSANVAALARPLVERGHVAAWVGVGAPGQGPGGTDEWLQIGLNMIAGNAAKLYYEVAAPANGIRYFELASNVPAGRHYDIEVLEMHGRRDTWRVWLNGSPASPPIWLPGSHARLTPMAIAENFDGGAPSCNRYEYSFRRLELASSPGGGWSALHRRNASVLQDRGYQVVPANSNGFDARTTGWSPRVVRPNLQRVPVSTRSHWLAMRKRLSASEYLRYG